MVILDLEDAVAPDAKTAAREAVAASALDPIRTIVRVNPADSPDHARDVEALRTARPKPVYGSSDVTALHELLREQVGVPSWFTPMLATDALLTDPAAWAIAVAGAVGFFVQTVALQVGAVNGVTAMLVVGETAGPSIVGVAFLGDKAHVGLGWLAVVGFIGAVIGAVLVAVYSTGDPDHFGEAPPEKGGWRRCRESENAA